VTHSTLVGRYGVDVAIRAFAELAPRWPELTLRVIGDGEQREALERLARELQVGDRVVFTGQLPWAETIRQVERALVGIVSVLDDGYGEVLLPTKLLEYARFGVPAACARLTAVLPYFPDDSLSYFTPGNATELAAAIERLLRDPALRARQAGQAQRVVRGLAWERVRYSYLEALGLEARKEVAAAASPA
jgi:glycosyltransferase involved in cell wall biosynthesis